jgi:BirA family biotin operon repressor/biotin-[acetyl-CoA-carboxylase] ligase
MAFSFFKPIQNTLFFGKNLIELPTCGSTNAEAQQYIQTQTILDGTVIITPNQTSGRGQRGNIWEAQPYKNLTFSLIVLPKFLTAVEQFKLNVAVTVAMVEVLQKYIPAQIKWSNDIYVNNQKIGGLLIEIAIQQQNIQSAIIGIGLNINQVVFDIPQATSLAFQTSKTHDLQLIFEQILAAIEVCYLQLRAGNYEKLKAVYLQNLYRYQEWHEFKTAEDVIFKGMIIGIDSYGRLAIQTENETKIQYFNTKEIIFQ